VLTSSQSSEGSQGGECSARGAARLELPSVSLSSQVTRTHSQQGLTTKLNKAEKMLSMIEKSDKSDDNHKRIGLSSFTGENERRKMKLMKHATTQNLDYVEYGVVGKLVASSQFDVATTLVVLLNAVLIGAQVQHNATSDKSLQAFQVMEFFFTFVFTAELCARLSVYRSSFFTHPQERWWNIFDFCLVGIALLDTALALLDGVELPGAFMSKLGRAIRLLRILRIIRVVRKLAQLRGMLHMIISSLQSLFWVLVIMLGLIYMVSVVLTQGATHYLKGQDAPKESAEYEQVLIMYGSLFSTMYTLFQCMSGGISWGLASHAMRDPGWLLEAVVISYVFFMVFAVANIVNGIFVDGAIESSKKDRSMMMQKQKDDHENKERHVVNLLTMMDQDGDQLISFQEFLESLEQEEVRDFLAALEVDVTDAKVFFEMLDRDGSGTVDIMEFTSGMRKFRGEAKSVDLHMLLYENKRLFKLVSCLVGTLCAEWEAPECSEDLEAPTD
jgi:voltage-gated sodium channel